MPLGLLHSKFGDQIAQPCALSRSKIEKLHPDHLSSDPQNDRIVTVHTPGVVWGEEKNMGSDTNGTYLSFAGWPWVRMSSLAIARGLVSSG